MKSMNIIESVERLESWRPSPNMSESERKHGKFAQNKFKAVRDTVRKLVDLNNTMSCEKEVVAGIVAGLVNEHPHLQHKTILALFQALGEIGLLERRVDDRNRFTRWLCTKLRERFQDELFWGDK